MPCLVLVTFLWFGVPQMPSKTDFSGILIKIRLEYHHVLDACAARGLHRLVIPQDLLLQNSYLSIFPGLQASKPANLQAFNPPRRVTRSANNPPAHPKDERRRARSLPIPYPFPIHILPKPFLTGLRVTLRGLPPC